MKKVERYYKKFYKEISKYREDVHQLYAGISEEGITKFEDSYNINLPHYYREWLKINNGGILFKENKGIMLAGVKNPALHIEQFEIADNFDVSKRIEGMPNYLLFLAKTSEGDYIGYDLNHTDSLDGEIVYWDCEEKVIVSRWDNFGQWLEDEMAYWKELVDYDGIEID